MQKIQQLLKILGPGILMAGAAIGVSHLVQSTRAGAVYGFELLWLVIFVNLIKYPFFEFAHRFSAATGTTVIDGYQSLGRGYLISFFVINILTSVGSIAAVFYVTASLFENLTGFGLPLYIWVTMLMAFCFSVYVIGRYHLLNMVMKILMFVLFVATTIAFIFAIANYSHSAFSMRSELHESQTAWQLASLPFLLALMGWMPGPIEMSAWQSLWIKAQEKDNGKLATLKEAQIDFNVGYFLCIILAAMFLSMGALTMYGTGEKFSGSGAIFAGQVVSLYAKNIGDFATPIIAIAAFATMFSTSFTLLDAYPRSLAYSAVRLFSLDESATMNKLRWIITFICCIVGIYISYNTSNLKLLVDAITISAFIAAPFLAYLNHKLIFSELTPEYAKPSKFLRLTSLAGMSFLVIFAFIYLYSKLI